MTVPPSASTIVKPEGIVTHAFAPLAAAVPVLLKSSRSVIVCPAASVLRDGVNTITNFGATAPKPPEPPELAAATGVALDDAVDALDVPPVFVAVTVNVYAVPFVRPVTVHVSGPLVHEHVLAPGCAVTVYPVIGEGPPQAGAAHDTTLCASAPLEAETLVGAPGNGETKIVALP